MIASLRVAGVDEAGRGCWAGSVYAAAVVLGDVIPAGLNDSKQLSARQRDALYAQIVDSAEDWAVGHASAAEIDQLNILQASLLAMQRAVAGLRVVPDLAWVDGNQAPRLPCTVRTLVGGDAQMPAIMAASIIAKVTRDRELVALDTRYPGYGFAQHKGYGTAQHRAALAQLGVCAAHRLSFAPCRQAMAAQTGGQVG